MTLSKGEIPDMWSGETVIKQGAYQPVYQPPTESDSSLRKRILESFIDPCEMSILGVNMTAGEDLDTLAGYSGIVRKVTTEEIKTNLNKEENNMNTRKIVNIHLIDDSLGLPVEKSIVAIYEGIVTEDSQEVTIQQLLMDKDVKGAIAAHNEARTNIVDNAILERTGNSVMLRPVTLKDLRWAVK